jgi:hypothetical protein
MHGLIDDPGLCEAQSDGEPMATFATAVPLAENPRSASKQPFSTREYEVLQDAPPWRDNTYLSKIFTHCKTHVQTLE